MSRRYVPGLIYDEAAPYDSWMKYIIVGLPLLLVVAAVFLIPVDIMGTYFMLGDAALIGLIFHFVMPRRYQIFEDKIRIVLGGPFRVSIPFTNVRNVQAAGSYKSMVYSGMRFATTSRSVVEIIRKKGMNIVISPADRDRFMEQYRLARQAYSKMYPDSK